MFTMHGMVAVTSWNTLAANKMRVTNIQAKNASPQIRTRNADFVIFDELFAFEDKGEKLLPQEVNDAHSGTS